MYLAHGHDERIIKKHKRKGHGWESLSLGRGVVSVSDVVQESRTSQAGVEDSVEKDGVEADRVDALETGRKCDLGHGGGDRGHGLVGDGDGAYLDALLVGDDVDGARAGDVAQDAAQVDGREVESAAGPGVDAGDVGVRVAQAVQFAVSENVGVGLGLDGLEVLPLVIDLGKSWFFSREQSSVGHDIMNESYRFPCSRDLCSGHNWH